MLKKYPEKINLVVKHFPLSRHKFAKKAAIAALSAEKQGKYSEMIKILMKNYKNLNDTTIQTYAKEIGLDMEKFERDLKDPSFGKMITDDLRLGRKIKVTSVPSIFINGKPAKKRSLKALSEIIDKELRANP